MKTPTLYNPEQFLTSDLGCTNKEIQPGKWVMARPEGFWGLCLGWRLKAAWMVFTGRWDALRWEGQE